MTNGGYIPVVISGCITLDASPDPALDNSRTFLHNPPHHLDRLTAATNLLACLKVKGPSVVNIIGNGYPGLILTGSATPTAVTTKFIGIANDGDWEMQANLLAIGKAVATTVRFCGCDTGADQDGARLTFELAKALGLPVEAPTGVLFCDKSSGFFFEASTTWQHADPGDAAPPKIIKRPVQYVTTPMMDSIVLASPSGDLVVRASDVREIAVRPADVHRFTPVSFSGADAQRLVTAGQFNVPRRLNAAPLALVTGYFDLTFEVGDRIEVRSFRIYNDRLLQDETATDPNYFYFANVNEVLEAAAI